MEESKFIKEKRSIGFDSQTNFSPVGLTYKISNLFPILTHKTPEQQCDGQDNPNTKPSMFHIKLIHFLFYKLTKNSIFAKLFRMR